LPYTLLCTFIIFTLPYALQSPTPFQLHTRRLHHIHSHSSSAYAQTVLTSRISSSFTMSQRTTERQLQVYRDVHETNAESSLRPSKRSRATTEGQPSLAAAQPTPAPVLADGILVLRDISNLPERARRFAPGETI
ncbi:MAG: hypothetical protein J3R72DRAFT_449479, partial [Linnemannia gamsii]